MHIGRNAADGPRPGGRFPKTELRSHRHHQQHGPGAPGQLERNETPVPVRSNALDVRFQSIRLWADLYDAVAREAKGESAGTG
jgi:hypothetical protein